MNKKILTLCLSTTMLVGALLSVGAISNRDNNELFFETTSVAESFESGKEVKLSPKGAIDSEATVSEVKAQVSDIDENGNRSIRFVAAITSLDVRASFIREMLNEDESVDLTTKEMEATTAFTSIEADGEVVYPSSFGEEFNYFITYTLQNIPEDAWYNRLDVKVKVNDNIGEKSANVEGLMPMDERLSFSATTGGYEVEAISNIVGDITIPSEYKSIDGAVATRMGNVVAVEENGFSDQDKITNIVLPDTITTIDANAFYNCSSVESINLPYALRTIGTDAFYGMSSIETVYYDSYDIYTCASSFDPNPTNVYISKDIVSIHSTVFSDGKIENVVFEGTLEELSAIKLPSSGPIFKYGIKTSDAQEEYVATFNFDGATLKLADGTICYDKYELKGYYNSLITNPGTPEKDGYNFLGWFQDAECLTPATIKWNTKLINNISYYAGFEEKQAVVEDGLTMESAFVIDEPYTENGVIFETSGTTTSDYLKHYYRFVPTVTDIYYFEETSGAYDSKAFVYIEGKTTTLYEQTDGSGIDTRPMMACDLVAGTMYTFAIGGLRTLCGDYNIKLYTKTGDTLEEAIDAKFGVNYSGSLAAGASHYYKLTPSSNMTITIDKFAIGDDTKNSAQIKIIDENSNVLKQQNFRNLKYTTASNNLFTYDLEANKVYYVAISLLTASSTSGPTTSTSPTSFGSKVNVGGGTSYDAFKITAVSNGNDSSEGEENGLSNATLISNIRLSDRYTITLVDGKAYFKFTGQYFTDCYFDGFTDKIAAKIYEGTETEPKTLKFEGELTKSNNSVSISGNKTNYYYVEVSANCDALTFMIQDNYEEY